LVRGLALQELPWALLDIVVAYPTRMGAESDDDSFLN
jgi:hypothetical protein